MTTLGVCAVDPRTEQDARERIERAGFGTRVPTYRVSSYWRGKQHTRVQPLFPGYVFTYLEDGWGMLSEIEGVRPIYRLGNPSLCSPKDEEELLRLEKHCLLGDFNKVQAQPRSPAGRFKRQKKRRPRPRPGKRLRAAA